MNNLKQKLNMVGSNLGEMVVAPQEPVEEQVVVMATPIDNPDAQYLAETTKIDISGLTNGVSYNSITDGTLTVTFSTSLEKQGPVPDGWATWSSPPFSEDPNPHVLISGTTTLTMELSDYVRIFGFELEPNSFSTFEFTARFYQDGSLVEEVTRTVSGNAGARLFARTGSPINRVEITGGDTFAIAQVRYQLASPLPFWVTLAVLILILILALILL